MKKVIFGALALGMIMFACQKEKIKLINEKESNNNSEITNQTINNIHNVSDEIKMLSINYIKEKNIDIQQQTKLPKWLEVALSDIIGAATGATAVFNGGGSNGGIIGGAVFVGSAASAGAAIAASMVNNNGNSGIIYNNNNSYEAVGKSHYILVDEAMIGSSYWFNNGSIDYNLFIERGFDVLRAQNLNCDEGKADINPLSISNQTDEVLNSDLDIISFVNNLDINNEIKNILNDYYQVMLWSENNPSEDFAIYSISVENAIINSELSESDKLFLLLNMSTTRIGFQYWKI